MENKREDKFEQRIRHIAGYYRGGALDANKAGEVVPVRLDENKANTLSQRTKELHFSNTPLDMVIRDLSDYYAVPIVVRTGEADKRLTATFNDLPLEETLLIINQTLDVHLVSENGL